MCVRDFLGFWGGREAQGCVKIRAVEAGIWIGVMTVPWLEERPRQDIRPLAHSGREAVVTLLFRLGATSTCRITFMAQHCRWLYWERQGAVSATA